MSSAGSTLDVVAMADMAAPWLLGLFLIVARVSSATLWLPGMTGTRLPSRIRALFVFLLSGVFALGLGMPVVEVPDSPVLLAILFGREVAIGGVMGLAVRAVTVVAEIAGSIAGISMGLSLNVFVDPSTGDQSIALGALLGIGASLLFIALDGHHYVLMTVFEHLQHHPVGLLDYNAPSARALAGLAQDIATTALQLAAPVVVVTLLGNISLAFISRAVPALNLFGVGLGMLILGGFLAMGMEGDAMVVTVDRMLGELPRRMVELGSGY